MCIECIDLVFEGLRGVHPKIFLDYLLENGYTDMNTALCLVEYSELLKLQEMSSDLQIRQTQIERDVMIKPT